MLEKRELLFAANWTNVLQPLDVTGDEHPDVSPLDVLAVINELNSPVYAIPHSQSLPTDVPDESKRPFLDVDCDQFVSPLDALIIINAINSGIYDPSWEFDTNGGSSGHAGRVVPAACSPKLIEGDSFRTELSAKVVVPATPSAIKLQFDSPAFDTRSLGLIRDAFEIALLDAKGNSIVAPIITRGNAIYNATEGIESLSATGITTNQNEVLIGLNGIQAGTTAHVVVRLINNDGDETSQVRIKRVQLVASDLKANLIMPPSSSDPVGSSAPLLGPSLPSSAPPLPPDPNPLPDAPVIKLVTLPASLAFGTRLALSGNVSIKSSPAGQPANRIQSIFINEHPVEALDAAGNFFDTTAVQAGQNRFTITAIDAVGRSASKTVALMGVDSATLQSDLSRYDDVSASFAGLYGRTQYGDAADLLTVELASKNDGTFSVDAPLLVTVANISDPTVKLRNADGITPQGNTYLNYSNGISGKSLSPSTATGLKRIEFYNPNQVQFKYDLGFFSKINSAPIIATSPVIEAIVDKAYSYSIQATDENGDSVSYRLVESPKSMTIDSSTGKIAWTPKTADVGNHNIVIEATDGRGGVTAQRFTLAVTTPKPNRPPVFNSTPIVDAFRGEPYVYTALATDADGDTLSYQLVDGAPGLQIDSTTGQLKMTLPGAVIFDAAKDFSPRNNPVGPWSYGWTQDQGSEFHLFPNRYIDRGLDVWNDPSIGSEPVLVHNGGATLVGIGGVVWQPGQLSVHPGSTNNRAVVRWTAPASGKAQIGAAFSGLDATTTDVHVLQNGKSVFDGNVNGRGSFATMVPTLLLVMAGDAIDFVVGFGNGTYFSDTTALDAVVQMDIGTVDRTPVTLSVVDGHGGTAKQSFTIDIHDAAGNHEPKIISIPQTSVSFGETYTDTVFAIDPDADPLTYSLPVGPIGMTIDANTGKLTWQGFEDQKNISGPSPSNGMKLSFEAIATGYELTEFARNIPAAGGAGPLGIAFPVSGGVLVSDHGGNVRQFPTDVDGQDASRFSPAQNFGFGRAFDMAQIGRKIYMSQRDNGAVVELNDDGTFKQTIVGGLGSPHGIATNPSNGHLIVSSYTVNAIYDVDPVAKTASLLFSASLDGISISADGSVLYGAAAPSGVNHIYGYSLVAGSVGRIVFDSGIVLGDPDGTALGGGILASTIFANNNNGTIIAIDLNTKKQTVIASGGTRGDFAKIDPNNGTMLLTQTESVIRLRLPLGSSFTATTNGLKLTADAISAGFELTEFARKFPVTNNIAGPLGIAFPSSGGVLVSDYGGNVRRFPSHADGQDASLFAPSQNYGFNGANDIARVGRNLYMTQYAASAVAQINDDGTFNQTIVTGLKEPTGIVVNPVNGHLIVSSLNSNVVYDMDPIAKTASVIFNASLDGLTIAGDGSILYGATLNGHIVGYSLIEGSIGNIVFDSGFVAGGPDGIAIGGGEFEGQLFVNTNQGSLVAIDLKTKQQTTIASGGTRGDFVKVDPTNGTLLLTQTDTIARLRLPFGSSFVSDFDVKVHVYDGKGGSDDQDFRLHLNNVHRGEIRGKATRDPIPPGSEPGLAGYMVFLDQNQNGRLDPFEKSIKTDLNGNYAFKNLIPATYYVTEVTQAGRKLTIPAEGNYALNLGAGQILTGIDFTNSESTVAEIRGMKFNDLNGDGVRLLEKISVKSTVPGTSDPWLSGMPNGSNASQGDTAPGQSPAYVDGLILYAGTPLTFEATGSVNFVPSPSNDPPDGSGLISHGGGAENGISDIIAPANSLIAVFLGSEQPNLSSAPPKLDFQPGGNVTGGLDYLSLAPKLKQVFFVGDGLTQSGKRQQIIVPEGATRLFLGSMDGTGWFNNFGAFSVTVNGQRSEPGLRDWKVYLDVNGNGVFDTNEPSSITDENGQYAFTNLIPGSYAVAESLTAGHRFDAVSDFSFNANPNDPWTYGYTTTRGTSFNQMMVKDESPQIELWKGTSRGPDIIHNKTGNTIRLGSITYTADTLSLDPSFDGRNTVLRFTAPASDNYRVQGRFQGIDSASTDVAILKNSQTLVSGDINGFFTDVTSTPGAILSFNFVITANKGDTIDFSVGSGTGGVLFDSTGLSATIIAAGPLGGNWKQTAPAAKVHQIAVVAGEVRRQIDFGNQNLAAAPLPNQAPKLTSTPATQIDAGVQYVYQAKATDVDGDKLKFDLPVKPVGMAIDPNSGIIVWTPTFDQVGVQSVILRVSDGRGGVDFQSFQINVSEANIGPIITSKPPGPAVINLPYQYRIRAQDANGDPITFGLKSRPLGDMAVDSKTGVFTWRPTAADFGTHSIDVTATDPDGDGQGQRFDLIVLASAANRIPSINSTPRLQARLGSNYLYSLDVTDPDGDPLTYQLDVSPTGMTIDSTGLVTWTPLSTQFGGNQVKIRVSDGRGGEQSQSFTINVLTQSENHAPAFTSTAPITATLGTGYRYAVVAYDADGDTIAYSLIKGPKGMSIDTLTGAIRWTPTEDQIGSQEVIVQAMDPLTASTTQRFTITVRGTNLPPAISSVPITVATVGRVYTYAFRATDPEGGPLSYSLVDRSGDMSISASGIVQWIPTVGELSITKVTIRVRDELGATADQSYSIVPTSVGPNLPPIISSQPILAASVGQQYRYQVTATDPEGGAVRFAFLDVPVGMTIDENTGLILWTSSLAGIGRVTVLVGDFDGGETEQSFEVTVRSTNAPPKIDSTPITNVATSVTYHYDVHASDPNLDPLTYTLTSGPAGMAIDTLGRITWTTKSTDIGKQHVKVTVTDDSGAFVVQEYDLVVTLDTEAPKVRIQVSSNPIALNETLDMLITATDNTHVKALDVTVDGKPIALDSRGRASLVMSKVGSLQIVAVATDDTGNVGRQTKDVLVIDTTVTDAPEVNVSVPGENATITAPTDVIGTVKDPNLLSWKLEVIASDGTTKQFASGTSQVTNAKLGTFDPTLLQNDSYILRLTALNRGGLSSSIDTTVNVSGNLKLGNFTMTLVDMAINVSNIPITVSRTYDTLTANQGGELGFGWRLNYRDVGLQTSLVKTGDEGGGLFTPFRDGTRVYVTLPGGKREGFTFRPKAVALFDPYQRERDVPPEYQPGNGLNAAYFVPSFVPDKGVTDKLTVPRYQLTKQGREYFQFGGGFPYNPEDPSFGGKYLLTTASQTVYRIDAIAGVLSTVTDANGNTLEFRGGGVKSSGIPLVGVERDLQGRVIKLIDPMNKSIQYQYDGLGDLSTVIDQTGNKTLFSYSKKIPHYLESGIDAMGKAVFQLQYDASGRLIGVRDSENNNLNLGTDTINRIERSTDPLGNAKSVQYDERGNIIASTDVLGNVTRQSYDEKNNLLSVADALGNSPSYTYDENGNRTSETNALGLVTLNTYDPLGRLLSTTSPSGRTVLISMDERGNPLTVKDPAGGVTRSTYSASGKLLSQTDPDGHVTNLEYDSAGLLKVATNPMGYATQLGYDQNGNRISQAQSVSVSGGTQTIKQTFSFDAQGRQTSTVSPTGAVRSWAFDATNKLTSETDTLGRKTSYGFDLQGNIKSIAYPDGTSSNSTYDVLGRQLSHTDTGGRVTTYVRDKAGRVIETILPDNTPDTSNDNPRLLSEYDALGRRTVEINQDGARTENFYNAIGQLLRVRDSLGNMTKYEYDSDGQRVAETDALGRTTRFIYDLLGRVVNTVFPDGSSTSTTYFNSPGPNGNWAANVSEQIDEDGDVTTNGYDGAGHLISVIDAESGKLIYTYDEAGRMTSEQDANGHITKYEYDANGRLTATILPLGQRSTRTYDDMGNLISATDYNRQQIIYTYGANNKLNSKQLPNGSTVSFAYTALGERQTTTDSRGTTKFKYNDNGQLATAIEPDGTTISYRYSSNGRLTSLITPAGINQYNYDILGRLGTVTDATGKTTRYTYDSVGNLTRTEFPNGTTEVRGYDVRNRLISIETSGALGILAGFRYTLSPSGKKLTATDKVSGQVTTYKYDKIGRLVGESNASDSGAVLRTVEYSYDAVGNRIQRIDSKDGKTSYTYDSNDRLLTSTINGLTTQYTYDDNGNELSQITSPTNQILNHWDAENRLVGVDVNTPSGVQHLVYTYDTYGNRIAQSNNGAITKYLVDRREKLSQVLMEYSPSGDIIASFVRGNDLVSELRNGTVVYYVGDGLGSTIAIASTVGQIINRVSYDAFGGILSGLATNFGFAGEQFDSLTGWSYMRARYYDPNTGRWLSRDPFNGYIDQPLTRQKYNYAGNDPVNNVDPSGESFLVPVLGALTLSAFVYYAFSDIFKRADTQGTLLTTDEGGFNYPQMYRDLARNWSAKMQDVTPQENVEFFGEDNPEIRSKWGEMAANIPGANVEFRRQTIALELNVPAHAIRVLQQGGEAAASLWHIRLFPLFYATYFNEIDIGRVMVHEFSHVVMGTDDIGKAYGILDAKNLARKNPKGALRNADNYALQAQAKIAPEIRALWDI